ncbi:DUF2934 domain-containing protein [Neorhizobium galegae]|uniref:DUF2934 domain-containing protein n=1 Tax=Neorhizobium galegae TaxID=399 RepID=UPI0006216A89|nr:DUF2934 domain-containing protein [Neorhizobium galegae]CDZ25902.1 Hypothetical protein NGAL_HAMBI490_07360 [Neorhizobium galegae bv. officinalis]KAA9388450.1 DUF2934 domain-containing protein [Neorhizobium galegae]KAB1114823.1 DUF2934 domain-containing protein [Neorhizobium galegae]MCM2497105.1 DUF2934 domain-containing protein [Neorhizobium galegae]MCQ1766477.1 DUF2934 domain-containing protein [Neorhizobium galegae]
MAESEEVWIRKRAYTLWEEEGYPSGKDREHWERAKLEYATLGPTASKKPAAGSRGKSATAVKSPKAASKAATSKPAAKTAAAKASPAKTTSKAPAAAMPEAVQPAKKRSKKVPAGA